MKTKKIVIFEMVFSLLLFLLIVNVNASVLPFATQNKTISIDGSFADWDLADRIYLDDDGPDCGDEPGQDIREIYAAEDNEFIYLRYILNGPLDETFGYKFGDDPHVFIGKRNNEGFMFYAYSSGSLPNIPDSYVRIENNQFECKFNKSDVETLWRGKEMRAWCDQGFETVCRDYIGQASLLPMRIDFWWIQRREYENGTDIHRAAFAMKDQAGNYILQDVLSHIELYDPEGIQIQPTNAGFDGTYKSVSMGYDPNNGSWYADNSLEDISSYTINFNDLLKTGNYRIVVKDQSDIQYEAYASFNGLHDIPRISSETICAFKDGEGNLIWSWEGPTEYFSNVSTSIRTSAMAYDENGNFLGDTYIKVPTHFGWAFAPANLLRQLEEAGGKTFKIGVQIRTNDNNNRTYSNNVNWQEANACKCDINGDMKTGIVEAIYSLQVVAGVR